MKDNEEYVDVVAPIAELWAIIALICFGMMMGFVAGLGYSYFDMVELAGESPEIHGNVSIYPNKYDETILLKGIDIIGADTGIIADYNEYDEIEE